MKIRKAKKTDIENIWGIEKESREHHAKISQTKYGRLNKSKTDKKAKSEFEKNLEKDINGKKTVFLVAEINNEIVGWIFSKLGVWNWSDNPPKIIWIHDIGVLKKYRGKGIAKKLLKETEKIAKKRGVEYGYLTVWLRNEPAYNLYKRNKYEDFAIEMVKKF